MVSTSDKNLSLLIVGEPDGSLPAGILQRPGLVICRQAEDAIRLAAAGPFSAIAVVLSCYPDNAVQLLRDLHSVAASARLLLLAQMYEEPRAMELMRSCRNGAGSFVSDYVICPVESGEILGLLSSMPRGPLGSAADSGAVDELVRMATEDYLTGLKNRRYFDEFLIQVVDHSSRRSCQVSLAVLDIDGLKHYNDTWGHTVGDSVLRQAATFIKGCCRPHDIVARIGGDEFAVIFWDAPGSLQGGAASAQDDRRIRSATHPDESVMIERFRLRLAGAGLPLLGPAGIGTLAMSGGLATFPRDGTGADELYLAADTALLHAKRSGKNRIYLVGQG